MCSSVHMSGGVRCAVVCTCQVGLGVIPLCSSVHMSGRVRCHPLVQ